MTAISIKGTTGNVKSRREGGDIIVEKTIEKAVVTETHQGAGKRVKGKQKPRELITLSAADVKGLEQETAEKIKEAMKDGKEATKKQLQLMNKATNDYGEMLERKHKAAEENMAAKMETIANKLTAAKQATKETAKAKTKIQGQLDKARAELNSIEAEKKERKERKEREKEAEKEEKEKEREKRKREKSMARPTREKSVVRPTREKSVVRPTREKSVAPDTRRGKSGARASKDTERTEER